MAAAALLLVLFWFPIPFPPALPDLSPPALPTRALRSISAATASSALAETSASEASSSSRRRRSFSNVPVFFVREKVEVEVEVERICSSVFLSQN